jgi:hypothetical protein
MNNIKINHNLNKGNKVAGISYRDKFYRILFIALKVIPLITLSATYAHAVDLNAGAKEFFDPVLRVITDYSSTAIFAGGIIAAVVAPGDLRTKFGAAAGGMAVGGLVVLAAKKMLGVGA